MRPRCAALSAPRRCGALAGGIELDGRRTAPARVRVLHATGQRSVVEIVLHEGRKRQVRRMCEAVGHHVLSLHRSAYARPAPRLAAARRVPAAASGRARAAARRRGGHRRSDRHAPQPLSRAGGSRHAPGGGGARAQRARVGRRRSRPGAVAARRARCARHARRRARRRRRDRPACSWESAAARCPRWRIRASCTRPGRRPTAPWRCCSATSGWRGACARWATTRVAWAVRIRRSGSFRPLDPGELDTVRALARSAQRARARARDGEPGAPPPSRPRRSA